MKRAAKKVEERDDEIDLSRVRLVRRGPKGVVRLTLRALREAAGYTQADVSKATGMAQGDISKLERKENFDDVMVSTLRRYLAAIGDEIEIDALSPLGHRIALAGANKVEGKR